MARPAGHLKLHRDAETVNRRGALRAAFETASKWRKTAFQGDREETAKWPAKRCDDAAEGLGSFRSPESSIRRRRSRQRRRKSAVKRERVDSETMERSFRFSLAARRDQIGAAQSPLDEQALQDRTIRTVVTLCKVTIHCTKFALRLPHAQNCDLRRSKVGDAIYHKCVVLTTR